MLKNPLYEKERSSERYKELFTLSLFTIAIAMISIIVMDLLIFPISLFAINRKSQFNYIITDVLFIIVIILLILGLARKVYKLQKEGFSSKTIIKYIAVSPLRFLATFFMILISCAVIIFILYILLSFNSHNLYLFSQN